MFVLLTDVCCMRCKCPALRLLYEQCSDADAITSSACCNALCNLVQCGQADCTLILHKLLNAAPIAGYVCLLTCITISDTVVISFGNRTSRLAHMSWLNDLICTWKPLVIKFIIAHMLWHVVWNCLPHPLPSFAFILFAAYHSWRWHNAHLFFCVTYWLDKFCNL